MSQRFPHLGNDSFQKLGWVEGVKTPTPGGRPRSRWHVWLALLLHSFLPETLGSYRQPRACSPPTSTLFVPARNVDETVHSFTLPPARILLPTLSDTPLPVVPPLPLSIRPRTSRRAQPALLRACAGSHALFPNTVRGGKLFALQAFILHFIPASIPAFASLRLFPWISGALVDRNVDLCGKRRAGGRALSMICESCELCSLGETRGKLMEQREQAMWTTVRPTDPPAVLLWAVGGGAERSGTCLPFGILC